MISIERCSLISIHALLAESDLRFSVFNLLDLSFLSTLSLRRATRYGRPIDVQFVFLSTLSLRRATLRVLDGSKSSIISIHALLAESDESNSSMWCSAEISIHALLAESDYMGVTVLGIQHNFYPRSPCGERPANRRPIFFRQTFLSTLSLRRATPCAASSAAPFLNFYPRSPCGERLGQLVVGQRLALNFYPRSPCGERPPTASTSPRPRYFYPRSPCGERRLPETPTRVVLNFYPRSPCGERRG